jgi:hypothetical protein
LIHEILALDHAPRTKEQEYILVDKLIDAWLCGKFFPIRELYDPRRRLEDSNRYKVDRQTQSWYTSWEGSERTMAIALTTSAILRGDSAEHQRLLDTYDTPCADPFGLFWWRSERFGKIRPADIAGMKGAPEVIRVLIANNCVFEFEREQEEVDVFALAAKNGNAGFEGLD